MFKKQQQQQRGCSKILIYSSVKKTFFLPKKVLHTDKIFVGEVFRDPFIEIKRLVDFVLEVNGGLENDTLEYFPEEVHVLPAGRDSVLPNPACSDNGIFRSYAPSKKSLG